MWRERLRAILRNKWAVAGIAVAGGAGLLVFLRRRQSGGGDDGGAGGGGFFGAQASPAYSGGPGGFDSVGTDVAHWLGTQDEILTDRLDQFAEQLTTAIEGLKQVPPAPAPPTTSTPPASTPKPATSSSKKEYVTVVKYTKTNTDWRSTLSGIASKTGTTVKQLLKLNPSIKDPNLIYPGQKIRVK